MNIIKYLVLTAAIMALDCKDNREEPKAAAPLPAEDLMETEETAAEPAANDEVAAQPSGLSGSLNIQLEPKEGASPDTVKNAKLEFVGRPELSATADENGKVEVENLLPGSLAINVLSDDGAALLAGPSQFGIHLPEVIIKAGEVNDLGKQKLKQTGKIKGKVTLLSNPNNLDVVGAQVFIPGTSFIALAGENGEFILAGIPEGNFPLYVMLDGFSTLKIDEVIITEAQTTDVGHLTLSLSNGPEGGIAVTAESTFEKDGKTNKISTDSERTVAINLYYDSDAALMKISDEPAFLNKEWIPVAKSASFTFESDGKKSIYVMYSDLNGLESSPYIDTIYIDTEAPILDSVTIMHGWAQTASENIYIDLGATDSSTGIAEIDFEGCTAGGLGTGVAYANPISCVITDNSAGPKTVTVTLRDYAGNESLAISDNISIGDATIIHNKEYSEMLTLGADQQPYLIDQDVTFSGGLTLLPGVTLNIDENRTVTIKGNLIAKTTNDGDPIIITQDQVIEDGTCDQMNGYSSGYTIDMSDNEPDATSGTILEYAQVIAGTIKFSGGLVKNSTFDSSCASGERQNLSKHGLDQLIIENNTFVRFEYLMQVHKGNAATIIRGNTGSVENLISQIDPAQNTQVLNNTIEILGSGLYSFQSFDLTATGNTFTGTVSTYFNVHSDSDIIIGAKDFGPNLTSSANCFSKMGLGNLTIKDMTFDGCPNVGNFSGGGDLVLDNVTITDSDQGFNFQPDYSSCCDPTVKTLEIKNSNIQVNETMFYLSGSDTEYTVNVHDSDIACTNGTGFCDFTFKDTPQSGMNDHVIFTNNNITCNGDATSGCRGFVFYKQSHGAHSGANAQFEFSLSGNTWTGKSPTTPIAVQHDQGSNLTEMYDLRDNTGSHATEVKIFKFDVPTYEMGLDFTIN